MGGVCEYQFCGPVSKYLTGFVRYKTLTTIDRQHHGLNDKWPQPLSTVSRLPVNHSRLLLTLGISIIGLYCVFAVKRNNDTSWESMVLAVAMHAEVGACCCQGVYIGWPIEHGRPRSCGAFD